VPTTYAVGVLYPLDVHDSGGLSLSVEWEMARQKEDVTKGVGTVAFCPVDASAYYLNVHVVKSDGTEEDQLFILPVTAAGANLSTAFVRWSTPTPTAGRSLAATIQLFSDDGAPARSIAWTWYFNNVPMHSGTGTGVQISPVQPGIYRIRATLVDGHDSIVLADSALAVQGGSEIQAAIVPVQPGPTLHFLGDVYSPWVITEEGLCTYLPYEVASISAQAYLLPGTTHFQPEIEGTIDDEAVLRTQTGNWTLMGPPNGLSSEQIPYDYQHNQPFIPAALDLKLRYTVDAWNVHGLLAGASKFRIKFHCYRTSSPVFQYDPCAWSAYPGGEGERQNRLIALITQADIECDADLHLGRSGTGVLSFSVPDQTELRARIETQGGPDQVFKDDRFFTGKTVICNYEAVDGAVPDLKVNATYGLAGGAQPGYLDFGQAAYPRTVQKVKRLYGKLSLFVAGGGYAPGTVFQVRIYKGDGPGWQDYTLSNTDAVYAPDYERYAKIGDVAIDLADFEFSRLGVVFDFFVNEVASTPTAPDYWPLPLPGDDALYSTLNSPALSVDGACFSNPRPLVTFEGTYAAVGTPIPSCSTIECGPLGLYCYIEVGGSGSIQIAQPLGFPAPFVAYQHDQTRCYGDPYFIVEIFSTPPDAPVFAYTGTSGCGTGYRYDPCGSGVPLAVIYPKLTSPHAFVDYGSTCYSFTGSVADLRPYMTVLASNTLPVASCADYACTGANLAGPVVVYQDVDTGQKVNVAFPDLDRGIARWGPAAQVIDPGHGLTPPATVRCNISGNRFEFLACTAAEACTLEFWITPVGYTRHIIRNRSGSKTTFIARAGAPYCALAVLPGDKISVFFLGLRDAHLQVQAQVKYQKQVILPHLYDTVVVPQAGASAIRALGFCGLNNRDDYVFFGSLPTSVEQDVPNPDSRVTAQGSNTQEMVLLDSRAYAEPTVRTNLAHYAGQSISGPITFRFYADRSRAGQHGEMDVWLDTDQPFPSFLAADAFQVAAYGTYSYRRDAQQGDLNRRSFRVKASPTGIHFPRVMVSAEGERVPVMTELDTVYRAGHAFVFTGTIDRGLSEGLGWDVTGFGSL